MSGLEVDVTAHRGGFSLALSMTVAPGTITALVGPNGAGKSTALAVIAGLMRPDTGRISIGGRTVEDREASLHVDPSRRRVGVVFQDLLLFPHLTVRDNVDFANRMRARRARRASRSTDVWLRRFDLEGMADSYPRELSGGQAQRVALARALASEPDLLLLDEPMASLDIRHREAARHALTEHLQDFRGATVLITHSFADVQAIADRAVVLEHGRVTQSASPAELRAAPATDYVARLVGGS